MKSRLLILALLLPLASCSTIEAMFGPSDESRENELSSENSKLETEISDLRGNLKQLKTDIDKEKGAELARREAEENDRMTAQQTIADDRLWVTVSFRSGYMELTHQSRRALKRLAKKFISKPRVQTIDVRGYTDDEPIGGYSYSRHTPRHPYSSNLELSQARAESVANALIKAGVAKGIVSQQGFGATEFVADNSTAAGREKNRRAEIHLIK